MAEKNEAVDVGNTNNLRVASMFVIVLSVILVTLIIGQKIALCAFIFLFLVFWAKEKLWMAIAQSAGAFIILEFMFDQLISVLWHIPIIDIGMSD